METKSILETVQKLRKDSKKRKFKQTIDLILNLKSIDIKNPEQKIDIFLKLPKPRAKQLKICALVDDELITEAKKHCNTVIHKDEFKTLAKNKSKLRKIINSHDFFITQPHLMPEVATAFGKSLGPKGKMPNPKAGCVIPPKVPLAPIAERLKATIRLQTKNDTIVKCAVGDESMKDEEIAENISAVYNAVLAKLPQKEANIKSFLLKLTMGSPIPVEAKK